MQTYDDREREKQSNQREELLRYSDRAHQNDQNALHTYNDIQINFLRKLKADPYLSMELPDTSDKEKSRQALAGRSAAVQRFLSEYKAYVDSLKGSKFNDTIKANAESNYDILDKVLNDLEHYQVTDIKIVFQEFSIPGSNVKFVRSCDFSLNK